MKRAAVLVKALLLVVVVAFVGWTAWDLAGRWRQSASVDLSAGWIAMAVVPIVGVSLAQALGWVSLVQRMVGRRLPAVASLELFLASMLGRYAPAKVGMPAILISRARQLALAPSLMGSSMLLIVLVYTILGVGIGVGALTVGDGPIPEQLDKLRGGLAGLAIFGMAAAVVLLLTLDRRRYPSWLLRKLEIEGEGPLVGLGMVVWYVVVWLCWWAHGALLIHAVGGTWVTAGQGAGLFVLAPVLGFLALVAPGGLGVREAVVAAGIGVGVGPGAGVVAALASRIISLSVDVVMWLIFRAWRR
ncbi:MAG: lysylphosphatidylglycerol synthase domain-containing protein, partial [Deltaproteobacteria bacterium]|nr:lysylphosphatidylglycerol synthase domain-containing protein [Deltaproteobacteria bacterium]